MGRILRAEDGRVRTAWRMVLFIVGLPALALGGGYAYPRVLGALGVKPPTPMASWKIAAYYALLSAVWFVWVALCRRLMDRRTVSSLGLRLSSWDALGAVGGCLLGVGLVGGGAAALYVSGGYRYAGTGALAEALAPATIFVFAAFAEEITCRGYILQNLRDIERPVVGVLVSSVVFSCFHAINPAMWSSFLPPLNLFLTGIVFALTYIASGNIWFPTAMHFGWNLAEGPVLGTRVSGISMEGWLNLEPVRGAPDLLTGGQFGLEGSVVVTAIQCVVICGFLVILWRRAEGLSRGVQDE